MSAIKKLILMVACVLIAGAAAAQQRPVENDIQQKVDSRLSVMKQQLVLNADQENQVKEILTVVERKLSYGSEKQETMEVYLRTELANVLTDEQMQKYDSMNQSRKQDPEQTRPVDKE